MNRFDNHLCWHAAVLLASIVGHDQYSSVKLRVLTPLLPWGFADRFRPPSVKRELQASSMLQMNLMLLLGTNFILVTSDVVSHRSLKSPGVSPALRNMRSMLGSHSIVHSCIVLNNFLIRVLLYTSTYSDT